MAGHDAARAAQAQLVKSVGAEMAPHDVRVNGVASTVPGPDGAGQQQAVRRKKCQALRRKAPASKDIQTGDR